MGVAAVIVNYRSADDTSAAVTALQDVAHVVLVDNDSGDGSVDVLRERHPDATLVPRATNGGFAVGVNAGVAATTERYVLLLNPDALPRAGAIAALTAHLDARPGCAVAVPRVWQPDGARAATVYRRFAGALGVFCGVFLPAVSLLTRVPALDRWLVRDFRPGERVAWGCGAALLVRRDVLVDVPLDEGFFLYFEEAEWQARLADAGWTVELVDADVDHFVHRTGTALAPPAPYIRSAVRYLGLRGYPVWFARRLVRAGLRGTQLAMRLRGRGDVVAAYTALLAET